MCLFAWKDGSLKIVKWVFSPLFFVVLFKENIHYPFCVQYQKVSVTNWKTLTHQMMKLCVNMQCNWKLNQTSTKKKPHLCWLQKSIPVERRDFLVICLQFHCFFLPHINGGYKSFWFLSFIWSLLREIKTMVSQRHLIISFEQRKMNVFLSLSRKSYFRWKTMTAYHGLFLSILQHRALNAD